MQLLIENVSKTYSNDVKALKNVSLEIGNGMFGLLGPNGAGKSTLMRTIDGLQESDTGRITIGDIDVSKELENKREKNIIGSSLDADVKILCSDNLYNLLSEYGNELKFIFITSKVILERENNLKDEQIYNINGEKLKVEIENSKNKKCERCWHRCISVGTDKNYKTLCVRCISNVYGSGEIRRYA